MKNKTTKQEEDKNTLEECNLFATYQSQKELIEYANNYNGSERAIFMIAMGLTWNTCAFLTNNA